MSILKFTQMPKGKTPDNLQDFTTLYLQKPIRKIIEELYALKMSNRELKAANRKLAKINPADLKQEIKRLKVLEKKYNQIIEFATSNASGSPSGQSVKKPGGTPRRKRNNTKKNE